jgi:hypothetical protein
MTHPPFTRGRGLLFRAYGPELEGFEYPFTFSFPSQGRTVSMTFMDVAPNKPNGRTVVLLHGKNFCAATWEATVKTLVEAGYRVGLLASRGIERAIIAASCRHVIRLSRP